MFHAPIHKTHAKPTNDKDYMFYIHVQIGCLHIRYKQLNPSTAQACKIYRLNNTQTHLQTE